MIQNEARYKEKILTQKEEEAVESNLNTSIIWILCSGFLLISALISIIFMIVISILGIENAAGLMLPVIIFVILSVFMLFLSDRDVISSKGLNERLFLYFHFLEDYVNKKGKRTLKIWMINRRLIKYLYELEKNLKNLFFYNSGDFDIQLIEGIRNLLREDMSSLIRNEGKVQVLALIEKIKQAYLSSEGMSLISSQVSETHINNNHEERIHSLKEALEACRVLKREVTDQRFFYKAQELMTKPSFLIILITIAGGVLMYYINNAEDYSRMPANIGVVSLVLTIVIFIVQSRK